MELNFDIKEFINSIIEWLQVIIENVQKAITVSNGYEKEENYPDNFPKAE